MRRIYLFTFFFVCCVATALAQEPQYEYVPLVREGVKWVYMREHMDYDCVDKSFPFPLPYVEVLEIKGEQPVDGVEYKQVMSNRSQEPVALIREDGKQVFIKASDYYIEYYLDYDKNTGEYLIYDFNKEGAGYENFAGFWHFNEKMIEIGGVMRKAYFREGTSSPEIIEGIGVLTDHSPFYHPYASQPDDGTIYGLTHMMENDEIVYKTDSFNHYEYYKARDYSIYFGDVNADSHHNVADVSVYFELLMQDIARDVNGDGQVNVGDISTLYNVILAQ